VCAGGTGHVEVVLVEFDPKLVSFERLLAKFWEMHNPAQGTLRDPESQYRSAVYVTTEAQLKHAEAEKQRLEASGSYPRGIATEIRLAPTFWRAEEYHQRYYEKKGFAACRI
jgi:peptide-methionine (S)-S-oxide reductase